MSKEVTSKESAIKESAPFGRENLSHVRVRTGGVHFSGARIISTLTVDKTAINLAGNNVVVCEAIKIHPAGVYFEASAAEGGGTFVIPYANVEVMTVA